MNNELLPAVQRDAALFLRIAAQGAGLDSHAQLWRWLQGDVQQWLRHDAMIVGWGDFGSARLECDVISSMPGLRTHELGPRSVSGLLGYLRDCWAAALHAPCQVNLQDCSELLRECTGLPWHALAAMRTAVVWGTRSSTPGGERIFAALSTDDAAPASAAGALKLLVPFVDGTLRRIPPVAARSARCEREAAYAAETTLAVLSERELQIMKWVALGKTNPEIGCILQISEFTVKNHMKSIFAKLDVTNRAQAVAKLALATTHA